MGRPLHPGRRRLATFLFSHACFPSDGAFLLWEAPTLFKVAPGRLPAGLGDLGDLGVWGSLFCFSTWAPAPIPETQHCREPPGFFVWLLPGCMYPNLENVLYILGAQK